VADAPVTVIGAGVVGLAVAARLAPAHPGLVVLERHRRHGQETSSRNSEVVHAGIYYTPGSLKARLCVEGNRRLYEYCQRRGVSARRTGKLISASRSDQLETLEGLWARGSENGVSLRRLSPPEAADLEPRVLSAGALFSPDTGIVSAHELMDALLVDARRSEAIVQLGSELLAVERSSEGFRLTVRSGEEVESFTSERVVNAAGLDSDRVATLAGIDVAAAGYQLHHCKGSYFSVSPGRAAALVSRLVYPVPDRDSLGVHVVLGLDGRLRFGPDAEYLPGRAGPGDYAVDESKRKGFGAAARQLIPSVRDQDLSPDMAGVRPKLQAPGEPPRDFVIAEESGRGLGGFVNLIGIESPGLTSALAIADHVASLIAG